jgi:hypothetical protein
MGAKNKGTMFREERKLSLCMPLSSNNDRQLKNFSDLNQTDNYLGSVLLVEFVGISVDRDGFGHSKNCRPRSLTGKESSNYKRSVIKIRSKFLFSKSFLHRIKQSRNFHPTPFGFVQKFNGSGT